MIVLFLKNSQFKLIFSWFKTSFSNLTFDFWWADNPFISKTLGAFMIFFFTYLTVTLSNLNPRKSTIPDKTGKTKSSEKSPKIIINKIKLNCKKPNVNATSLCFKPIRIKK